MVVVSWEGAKYAPIPPSEEPGGYGSRFGKALVYCRVTGYGILHSGIR